MLRSKQIISMDLKVETERRREVYFGKLKWIVWDSNMQLENMSVVVLWHMCISIVITLAEMQKY